MCSLGHPARGQCFTSCHQCPERCSLVADLTWHIFSVWRLPPRPGEKLVWVERLGLSGWNGLICSLLSVSMHRHCRWNLSRALTTLPLGTPWSQAFPHYSQWKLKWLHFQWKKEKKGKNVFRKLRSELVRCVSVASNCSRLIDILHCALLFLSIRYLK